MVILHRFGYNASVYGRLAELVVEDKDQSAKKLKIYITQRKNYFKMENKLRKKAIVTDQEPGWFLPWN